MKTFTRSCLIIFSLACLGCKGEQRASLHEADHVTPIHWPKGLSDAAEKLDQRLRVLQTPGKERETSDQAMIAQRELIEIVGWIPEIAADSFISESQWEPVNEASLELSRLLQSVTFPLDAAMGKRIEQFRDLLIRTSCLEVENRPSPADESESEEIHTPGKEFEASSGNKS